MYCAELDALGLALGYQDLVDPLLAGSGDLLRNVCLHVGTEVHLWTLKDQMPLAGHMRSLAGVGGSYIRADTRFRICWVEILVILNGRICKWGIGGDI